MNRDITLAMLLFFLLSVAVILITTLVGRTDSTTVVSPVTSDVLTPYVVGTDAPYSSIQSAINAAAATQRRQLVVVKAGTYVENITLLSGVNISGVTNNSTIILQGTISANFTSGVLNGGSDVEVTNMTIAPTSSGSPVISIGPGDQIITFDQVEVTGAAGTVDMAIFSGGVVNFKNSWINGAGNFVVSPSSGATILASVTLFRTSIDTPVNVNAFGNFSMTLSTITNTVTNSIPNPPINGEGVTIAESTMTGGVVLNGVMVVSRTNIDMTPPNKITMTSGASSFLCIDCTSLGNALDISVIGFMLIDGLRGNLNMQTTAATTIQMKGCSIQNSVIDIQGGFRCNDSTIGTHGLSFTGGATNSVITNCSIIWDNTALVGTGVISTTIGSTAAKVIFSGCTFDVGNQQAFFLPGVGDASYVVLLNGNVYNLGAANLATGLGFIYRNTTANLNVIGNSAMVGVSFQPLTGFPGGSSV